MLIWYRASRERVEFTAIPQADDPGNDHANLPGQPRSSPLSFDYDADMGGSAHSVAMDSFTTAASTLSLGDICKICHCGSEVNQPLIAPCFCCGSLKYVHQDCLQRWIKSSDIKRCELCKYLFSMESKVSKLWLLMMPRVAVR
jgi:hypothetical protein